MFIWGIHVVMSHQSVTRAIDRNIRRRVMTGAASYRGERVGWSAEKLEETLGNYFKVEPDRLVAGIVNIQLLHFFR